MGTLQLPPPGLAGSRGEDCLAPIPASLGGHPDATPRVRGEVAGRDGQVPPRWIQWSKPSPAASKPEQEQSEGAPVSL